MSPNDAVLAPSMPNAPKPNVSLAQDKPAAQNDGQQAKRTPRPNYGKIHAHPLPVTVYPLPAFVPHNPLSFLRIVHVLISQYIWPPSSHPEVLYQGYFSAETRSVHITDSKTVRALWEMGFFGKGSLSRSEPNWLDSEKRRRGLLAAETSEEVTNRRRRERREMKMERARKEREAIEQQLLQDRRVPETQSEDFNAVNDVTEEKSDGAPISESRVEDVGLLPDEVNGHAVEGPNGHLVNPQEKTVRFEDSAEKLSSKEFTDTIARSSEGSPLLADETDAVTEGSITNEEHLQLTLEEAFFLTYGLGVLNVTEFGSTKVVRNPSLFELFRRHSYFPPSPQSSLRMDDPFLLSYVVYHHFRSLGWVIRPGVKFAVDYLLYNRGPVFSHAAFAVIIVPSYDHPYWSETPGRRREVEAKRKSKDWWWFHCVNRIQSQVVKTLVLVYVEVPPPVHNDDGIINIGKFLKRYKIREFTFKRWVANRSRE